jgi:hypothetical protein
MRGCIRRVIILSLLVAAPLCAQASGFVSFDDFVSGTNITTPNLYAAEQVIFYTWQAGLGMGQDAYVGNSGHPNHYVSYPNVVSYLVGASNWRRFWDEQAWGYVDFLTDDVQFARIVASVNLPATETTRAYVVGWLDDGSSLRQDMAVGLTREELGFNAPDGRHLTRLEYHGMGYTDTDGVYYDNLSFGQVPEPSSALLLLGGLGALAWRRQQWKAPKRKERDR